MPIPHQPQGYAHLASLMSTNPEFAIFRKFSSLNAQNLLYLQAELVHLEFKLRQYASEDRKAGLAAQEVAGTKSVDDRLKYDTNWYMLANSEEEDDDSLQWETVLEIRKKLKEYNEALAAAISVTGQSPPLVDDLSFLKQWLRHPRLGASALDGRDHNLWDVTPRSELVALHNRTQDDAISRFLLGPFIIFYHRCIRRHRFRRPSRFRAGKKSSDQVVVGLDTFSSLNSAGSSCSPLSSPSSTSSAKQSAGSGSDVDLEALDCGPDPYGEYDDRLLLRIATVVGTMLASLLPILSIVVLYFIRDMGVRLGVVTVFTLAFTIAFRLVTDAKMGELFAATSAFAAVQVVFLGSSAVTTGP